MNFTNVFFIKQEMELTLNEYLVYAILCCFSSRDGVSHITRQTIADKAGIKKLDTVTVITNTLEEKGLISKS